MNTSVSPAQQNLIARNTILYGAAGIEPAQDIWQEITGFSTPSAPAPGSQYSIYLRPVGLVKRIIIEYTMTVTAAAGAGDTLALTGIGAGNVLAPVVLFDLANYTRVNTNSWHLGVVASAKRRRPWGFVPGVQATPGNPYGYGDNVPFIGQAAAAIAVAGVAIIKGFIEVPVSYNDDDLRGAIYASVTQATMLLQFTINPSFFSAAGGDAVSSVYAVPTGGAAGTLSAVTFRIYQNYLDKLPMFRTPQGGVFPILPADDLSRAVLLTNSSWSALTANTDVSLAFVNSREFQSLTLIYDNGGVLSPGSDINYLAINSANLTPLDKVDPIMHSMRTRMLLGVDLPAGMYYWDFRRRPINTNQSGNTQAVINPLTVAANSTLFLGWEAVAQLGLVNAAGAIPSGA